MDLTPIKGLKTVLGDFSTFTGAIADLLQSFPKLVELLVKLFHS